MVTETNVSMQRTVWKDGVSRNEMYYFIQIEKEFNNSAECRSINGTLQWQVDVNKNCTGRVYFTNKS